MSMPSVVHVLDDDSSIGKSFQRLLGSYGWDVRIYTNATELEASGGIEHPGCLLLDMRMPDISGLDLLERLEEAQSPLAVVLISGFGDVPSTVRAMRHGAIDFLTKPVSEGELVAAVRAAVSRSAELWRLRKERATLQARLDQLTPREREVCALVARGLMNKQIASELGTSEKTVKVHRGRLMTKLQVDSVAELVRLVDQASGNDVMGEGRRGAPA
jgi:RNA polymerase sigma factor (sigma-70 family)